MRLPKTGNVLIPNIRKKIEMKLEELNLKPHITPKAFLKIHKSEKHRFFSPCKTIAGKLVGFYSRLHFNLDAKNKVIQEIKFLLKIKESKVKIRKFVPPIINFGIEKDFEWFTREFPKGKPLGFSRKLHQKIDLKLIPNIINIIFEILKIPPHFLPTIKTFNVEHYLAKEVYSGLVKDGILEKGLANSTQQFIKKNLNFLRKENRFFCHGDLHLENIISDGKNLWIIDWELIKLNNFAFDISFLWSHLWQAKKEFRQRLILEFLKKLPKEKFEKFKILFPIVTSFLALEGIRFKEKRKKDAQKRRKFYLKIFENFSKFQNLIKI